MSNKSHTPNCKICTCNKCGVTAHAVPGKDHRRCGGSPDAAIRPKHQNLPETRGQWQ